MWRLSYNGLFPISCSGDDGSNYKMFKYFKDKSAALLDSGIENVQVVMGYDYANKMVYITFVDSVNPANDDTIAFSEVTNRWVSAYDFIPDGYAFKNTNFYSFYNDGLWVHDSSTRCNFMAFSIK